MAPILPFTQRPPVEVFAVEDTRAQITWRRLPAGELTVRTGDTEHVLGERGRTGAAEVASLRPSASNSIELLIDGRELSQHTIETHESLGPEPLTRIATLSDLHLGEEGFGLVKEMRYGGPDAYPLRCAQAAAREAVAWGAELLVIKGDITNEAHGREWEMFDELLAGIHVPVLAIPGNHDVVRTPRSVDATSALRSRGLFPEPVHSFDTAGVRIVVVDSTIPGRNWGRIGCWIDELSAAVDVGRPALIFTHHHIEDRAIPRFWPPGIRRYDGSPVLDQLLAINPDIVLSSGHTHRNRIRKHGTALITEVSSTKDFPGVWAGYAIHDTGIRQSVRRITEPGCIDWTDRTHAAVAGIWGLWSPGGLAHRSHTHHWNVRREVPMVGGSSSLRA